MYLGNLEPILAAARRRAHLGDEEQAREQERNSRNRRRSREAGQFIEEDAEESDGTGGCSYSTEEGFHEYFDPTDPETSGCSGSPSEGSNARPDPDSDSNESIETNPSYETSNETSYPTDSNGEPYVTLRRYHRRCFRVRSLHFFDLSEQEQEEVLRKAREHREGLDDEEASDEPEEHLIQGTGRASDDRNKKRRTIHEDSDEDEDDSEMQVMESKEGRSEPESQPSPSLSGINDVVDCLFSRVGDPDKFTWKQFCRLVAQHYNVARLDRDAKSEVRRRVETLVAQQKK